MKARRSIVYLYSEVMPYAINIMKELRSYYNADVHCICWDEKKMTPFVPENMEFVTFYKRSAFSDRGLVDFIDDRKPEIIFVSGRMDKGYLKTVAHFRTKGIPVITACDNQWYGNLKNRIASLFSKYIYHRYFEYFWVPGRRQFEFAKRVGYSNNNILGYSLSADVERFGKAYTERRVLNAGKFPHVIVFAGRFAKEKGIDVLVKAFTQFKAEIESDWKLVVVGRGPVNVTPTQDIEVCDFMTTEQLATKSAEWGVFCLPSIWEPWGVVVHEFAAAGMPIIASDDVGAADTFIVDDFNGYVFKSGDSESLKTAFKILASKSDDQLWAMSERSLEMSAAITPLKAAHSFMSVLNKAR